LIGDHLMAQEQWQDQQQRNIDSNQAEIERLRENEQFRQQQNER